MKLNSFRTLGRSGLRVSPITLGAMTFGDGSWGADDQTSAALLPGGRRDHQRSRIQPIPPLTPDTRQRRSASRVRRSARAFPPRPGGKPRTAP
jgi:hypothetical protein